MSMLDIHAAAIEAVSEAYHNFLLRYDRTKKVVYGFVEGKDDPSFYRSVIERFLPEEWSVDLILAGSRAKVLQAEKKFDWNRYSRKQIAFFVDRDLTDFGDKKEVYSENTYVTDDYSIENSIVSEEMLLRLLSEVHNILDWTPEEKQLIIEHFDSQLEIFVEYMTPVMAQILYWRLNEVPANLNNLDLPSVFGFFEGEVRPAAGAADVDARLDRACICVGAPRASNDDLSGLEELLVSSGGAKRWVRGKYLIWFLVNILNEMHRQIGRFVAAYNQPPKSKMALGPKNVMVVAAPRARIPTSLRSFIEKGFDEFTRERQAA